jgi:hypothetical protein
MLTGEELGCGEEEEALARGGSFNISGVPFSPDPVLSTGSPVIHMYLGSNFAQHSGWLRIWGSPDFC